MKKLLQLSMKDFSFIPSSLKEDPLVDEPCEEIEVDFLELCLQMVKDNRGDAYASQAKQAFDWWSLRLTPDRHFRFLGAGASNDPEGKVGEHNMFGRAFCRWFLERHVGITYFTRLRPLLGKFLGSPFSPVMIKKVTKKGDTPDYLCTERSKVPKLAEAKGTQSSISFDQKLFRTARQQLKRVGIYDPHNQTMTKIKGYIVATTMANQSQPDVQSKLWAEDPETQGTVEGQDEPSQALYEAAIRGHYADIFDTLRLPLHAYSLREQFLLPEDHKIQVGLWTALMPPIKGKSFIGGFFPSTEKCPYEHRYPTWSLLNLSRPTGMFFGLELDIFLQVKGITLRGRDAIDDVEELHLESKETTGRFAFSQDGTLLAPLDYLRFDGIRDV